MDIMEQKLFITSVYGKNQEIIISGNLLKLFEEGWRIKQISAFGYSSGHADHQRCILLLEKNHQ